MTIRFAKPAPPDLVPEHFVGYFEVYGARCAKFNNHVKGRMRGFRENAVRCRGESYKVPKTEFVTHAQLKRIIEYRKELDLAWEHLVPVLEGFYK